MERGATSSTEAMIGTLVAGRYRIKAKLGSGGMSTVYLAHDETLERPVAVKSMHREISDQPDQIERFRQEARASAKLSHPNLVAVIDAGQDDGHPFIVFEYVPGETLKNRIEQLGRLPLDEAVAYAIEIGRGLSAAHAHRLIHRDVKPQNVLIDADGRAKVTDFGIARSLESRGLTATGRVLGTTDYVAPEQAMGENIDARADVYSLGIVLYEMLVGDVPFHADTQVGIAMKHINEAMPDIQTKRPEVSSVLAAALERATTKDPDERYPDMEAFLEDLEGALEVEVARVGSSHGEATTVLDSLPRPRRKLSRSGGVNLATVAILVSAAALALAITLLTGNEGPSREPISDGGEPVPLVSADDFDPPPGDNQEGPGEVSNAIDSNPKTTSWTTETYQTSGVIQTAAAKPGVGLVVATESLIQPSAMQIRSPEGGYSATIHTAETGPPGDLAGWGDPIATITNASSKELVDLSSAPESRYFLIWLTEVPPSETGFEGEISDVRISD